MHAHDANELHVLKAVIDRVPGLSQDPDTGQNLPKISQGLTYLFFLKCSSLGDYTRNLENKNRGFLSYESYHFLNFSPAAGNFG